MPEIGSNASSAQIFLRFLRLGCTSFGGPVAHLGYFRQEFVVRLRWLDEEAFAELVVLCQSLPGPSSSQLGFAIGLLQAGFPGAFAAWLAFTLPSAILMFIFARGYTTFHSTASLLHGLQLIAVAVVAQAVLRMAQSLTPDLIRIIMAVVAGFIVLFFQHPLSQLAAIAAGAIYGLVVVARLESHRPQTSLFLTRDV
jgi:chromate transporter